MSKPIAACATPSASCWPTCRASTREERIDACPDAGAGALHAGAAGRARWRSCARPMRRFDFKRVVNPPCSISAPTTCRPSISTSARTRSIATRGAARAAAPPAPSTDEIFRRIVTWFAPILVLHHGRSLDHALRRGRSVHLASLPATPAEWENAALMQKMEAHPRSAPRRHRRAGTRRARQGNRLQPGSQPRSYVETPPTTRCSTRSISARSPSPRARHVEVGKGRRRCVPPSRCRRAQRSSSNAADGKKCGRCWMVLEEVGRNPNPRSLQPLHRCGRWLNLWRLIACILSFDGQRGGICVTSSS